MGKPREKTSASEVTGSRSFRARIVSNEPVNEHHRLLSLEQPEGTQHPLPGQFYMLGTGSSTEPLLKRPFCFFHRDGLNVQVLYRVVGKGTRVLAETPAGASIEVVGPLGNTYPSPPRGSRPVVVTGGIGMASVFPFVEAHEGKCTVIYGARGREELMFLDELGSLAAELVIATDDGSQGEKGTVIDALKRLSPDSKTRLYVCGPKPMIRAAKEFAASLDIKGWASLEEYMACGIGACMGCVVNTQKGYRRVCKEGPVFTLEELIY